MAWVKLDDKMARGPKVKRAALQLGGSHPRARVLYVWGDAMSYCNLNLTDGFIPDFEIADFDDDDPQAVFRAMALGDDYLGAIVERDEARKGWVFRNYGDYQPLKADVEERLERERERKRKPRGETFRAEELRIPLGGIADSGHTEPNRTEPNRSVPDLPEPEPDPVEPTAMPAELMAAWNEITQRPIPRCRELTAKRHKHARVRLAKHPMSYWREVFARIQASSFCRGQNDRQWMPTFDWVIESDDPAVKVLEGKYDDRVPLRAVKPQPAPEVDWFEECKVIHNGACGLDRHRHAHRKAMDADAASQKVSA